MKLQVTELLSNLQQEREKCKALEIQVRKQWILFLISLESFFQRMARMGSQVDYTSLLAYESWSEFHGIDENIN